MSERVDLSDPALLAAPHQWWHHLRESAPVHRCHAEDGSDAWLITRYEHVRAAHLDPRLTVDKSASNGGYSGFSLPPELDANLLNRDGPAHQRLRSMVARAFTPRRVSALRARIDDLAQELVDSFPPDHVVDLVSDYAAPLPTTIIGDLLGVPRSTRDEFKTWTNGMFSRDRDEVRTSIQSIFAFLNSLIAHKKNSPADDLLSDLVTLRQEDDRLSDEELLSTAMLLMLAAYESPVHAIGNGLAALLTHPSQWRELRSHPDLIAQTVDEVLRFDPPNALAIRRFATEDLELAGCPISAGDTVLLGQTCAHRDPRRYTNPDTFDLHRQPQHLAFGHGPHFCLGAALGRAEVEIALRTFVTRCPAATLMCTPEQLDWRPSARSRGLQQLPVMVFPASGLPGEDRT